uniref:Abhydrolase_3 domain-containing protein n=1 Tax=Rhabditophanes sp. KR3021 TaxID=114890 RepID=A0AC35U151_9BILA
MMEYVFDFSLFLITISILIFPLLHIPLPHGIGDKSKVYIMEISLRFFNEYLGHVVGYFGHEARVTLARILTGIATYAKPPRPRWLKITNRVINGVQCRIYEPLGKFKKNKNGMIFIPGGGFCFLSPEMYDSVFFSFIKRMGFVVIAVNYSKAPEAKFPTSINESEAVTKEFATNLYKEYDVDPTQICICGDSAGGTIATAVAQRLMRAKKTYIRTQVLIYPITSLMDFQSPSYQRYYNEYKHTALLHPLAMARGVLLYSGCPTTEENAYKILRNQHISDKVRESLEYKETFNHENMPAEFLDKPIYYKPKEVKEDGELSALFEQFALNPDFAPIMAKDLHGLPPTLICNTGYDIIRDDGFQYAAKLKKCGVPTEHKYYEKGIHGTFNMPFSKIQKQMLNDICDYLDKQFSTNNN